MRTLTLLTSLLLSSPLLAQPTSPDPALGKWRGTITFEKDTNEFALEFKRDDKGDIHVYFYHSMINLFGMEIPGTITRSAEPADPPTYTNAAYPCNFTIKNDTLEGTYSHAKCAIKLKRTDTLPSEGPVPSLPAGPAPLWTLRLGAPIYAPVAVRDGTAYLGTTGGVFQAITLAPKREDVKFAWTFSPGRAIHAEALITDDAVYFPADTGFLYKLSRADGKELWRYDLADSTVPRVLPHPAVFEYDYRAAKPALIENTIYIGGADGAFHAVDPANGKLRWKHQTKGKIRTEAIAAGDNVIATSFDGSVYALNRASGSVAWTYDSKGELTSTPTLAGNHLLIGNRGSVLRSLDPATGTSQWRQLFWGSWVESQSVPAGQLQVIGSSDLRRVTCYDPADGSITWRTDVYGCPWGKPLVTDTRVYIGAMGSYGYMMRHLGGMLALDRATGKILWRWAAPEHEGPLQNGFAAGPAIESNLLLAGSIDGSLYAFPVKD